MFSTITLKNAPQLTGIKKFWALLRGYTIKMQQLTIDLSFYSCEVYKSKNERREIKRFARLFAKLKSLGIKNCIFEKGFKNAVLAESYGVSPILANGIYYKLLPELLNEITKTAENINLCIFIKNCKNILDFSKINNNISQIILVSESDIPYSDGRITSVSEGKACQNADIAIVFDGGFLLEKATVAKNAFILNLSEEILPKTLSKTRIIADDIAFRFAHDISPKLPVGNFEYSDIAEALLTEYEAAGFSSETGIVFPVKPCGFWSSGHYIGFRSAIKLFEKA